MRFIADNKVPSAIRGSELGLNVLIARKFVEPSNNKVVFHEPIARSSSLKLVIGKDLEGQLKTVKELILPLFGETTRTDNQAPLQVAPYDQLFYIEACHNSLASTGIIRQQKAEWLPWKHGFVDSGNLMREWFDKGSMNCKYWIEQMRKTNTVGLGNQLEEIAVTIKAPWPAAFDNLQSWLVIAEQQLIGDAAGSILVGEL